MKYSFLKKLWVAVLTIALLGVGLVPHKTEAAGSFLSKTAPDGRAYKLYVPSSYNGQAMPLVVMLHGCTQTADTFAAGTEMNQYAEQYGFLVAYPEQPYTAHFTKCWQWYDVNHQKRGKGEPASIVGVVNHVKSQYAVNSKKVYVSGLSAGAAMSVILGATYPDVFAAVGVHSGLEYGAASSMIGGNLAMFNGGPNPDVQGVKAYEEMIQKRIVPVIIFHGTADYVVWPINADQVTQQWAQTNDLADDGIDNNSIDATADETVNGRADGGRTYTHYKYHDKNGNVIMEKVMVNGMGHAWSGGSYAGTYTDPTGPKASEMMWNFFNRFTN